MKTIQHLKPNKKCVCHVRGCINYGDIRPEVILHRFPVDENLKKKWLSVLKINELTGSARVCNLHFLKSDYIPSMYA